MFSYLLISFSKKTCRSDEVELIERRHLNENSEGGGCHVPQMDGNQECGIEV